MSTALEKAKTAPTVKDPFRDSKLHYARLHPNLLETRDINRSAGPAADEIQISDVSVSLPTRLFWSPHSLTMWQPGENDHEDPVWPWLLVQCNKENKARLCRRHVTVTEATWCSEYGGAFAGEIELTDLWRLIAIRGSLAFGSSVPVTGKELEMGLVKIQIAGELANKPLVRLIGVPYRPKVHSEMYGPQIPSVELAKGICGMQGLEPSILCLDKSPVFSSTEPGWERIRMPNALAFTLVAEQHRCYLHSYIADARAKAFAMSQICWYLWDHADSIDCDDGDIPIKLRYETFKGSLGDGPVRAYKLSDSSAGIAKALLSIACNAVEGMKQPDEPLVEIEDAFNLLEQSVLYRVVDRKFSDADGTNTIVEQWWAYFGQEKARWVALVMAAAFCLNLSGCSVISIEFEELLRHPSGKCYII